MGVWDVVNLALGLGVGGVVGAVAGVASSVQKTLGSLTVFRDQLVAFATKNPSAEARELAESFHTIEDDLRGLVQRFEQLKRVLKKK